MFQPILLGLFKSDLFFAIVHGSREIYKLKPSTTLCFQILNKVLSPFSKIVSQEKCESTYSAFKKKFIFENLLVVKKEKQTRDNLIYKTHIKIMNSSLSPIDRIAIIQEVHEKSVGILIPIICFFNRRNMILYILGLTIQS
jgi:hypothetical protein